MTVVGGLLHVNLTHLAAFCQSNDERVDGSSVLDTFMNFGHHTYHPAEPERQQFTVGKGFIVADLTDDYFRLKNGDPVGWREHLHYVLGETNGLGFLLGLALFAYGPIAQRMSG